MEQRILGRTGLNASLMGLGGGGHSRLGMAKDKSESEIIRIIHSALDAGVNFIDTAEAYGTEPVVGKGIAAWPRDQLILSTKKSPGRGLNEDEIRHSVERSLGNLGTDYIDIYHLHGVPPKEYSSIVEQAYPVLEVLQQEGKIRFIGITERFERDTGHRMLEQALDDDLFDVVMVGLNLLNQSARRSILKRTQQMNVGVLIMFAVRSALSDPARLKEVMALLKAENQVADLPEEGALDFLVADAGADSIPDAAYRFCKHEEGVHVVLSGTSNIDHLADNIRSLDREPLPEATLHRLHEMFGEVDSVSGS
ncbi:MAG: aldo/keto reductase [Pseudomonadales bacterium]|nr:aldo/keto reductase [Pseudomonadales bacterium]MDP7357786.1 aldo/keto reductase [Pseudomonadales bacterium]MDP7595757.1 aldo/keto reductase [Pseudomonadales bacterium]HJN51962.1 aldo/keto reductase [Pseudomonadales bacterium]